MSGRAWIIYGAYGYTGRLLASAARARGMTPILAGRDTQRLEAVAKELNLGWRAFALTDPTEIKHGLAGTVALLNAAGPFEATARPLLDACLAGGHHYLDVSADPDTLEWVLQHDDAARRADVVVTPGLGFGVIATDCLALALKQALPGATHLTLAFFSGGGISPGLGRTLTDGLLKGGRSRRAGALARVPVGHAVRDIDFGDGPRPAAAIPWGDSAAAFHSTGIPNIDTFLPLSQPQLRWLKALRLARPLLAWPAAYERLQRRLAERLPGPSAQTRAAAPMWVWGEARDESGQTRTGRFSTGNGYDVTVEGTLAVVSKLLKWPHPPGTYTPAQLMGKDFVTELPGSSRFEIA